MIILRSAASFIARLLLAAVLVAGSFGPALARAGDYVESGHEIGRVLAGMPDHGCCDPDPSTDDRVCALACAQAACGATVIAAAAWPPTVGLGERWLLLATDMPAGIAVDPATPPPRA